MAADYGLLSRALPDYKPVDPTTSFLNSYGKVQDIRTQASTQNLQQQQAKGMAQQMSLQDLNTANNLFGAVALNPSAESYQQALATASKYHLDTSDAPPVWGQAAQAYVNRGAILSKQALEWKQAEAQLQMTRAQMQGQQADVNIKAQQSGLSTPFPNSPGGSTYNPSSMNAPILTMPGQSPAPQALQQTQPIQTLTGAGTVPTDNTQQQPAQDQIRVAQPLSGPAQMEMDKAQGKDIVDYQKELQTNNQAAGDLLSNIDAFKYNFHKTSQRGPRMGTLIGQDSMLVDAHAQEADKAANRLALALVPTLHTRLTQQELVFLSHSTLNRKLNDDAADNIADQLKAAGKRGQQQELFANAMVAKGVTNRGIIDSLWQKFVNENPVIDTSNGNVIQKNIDNWKDYTTKDAVHSIATGDPVHENAINQPTTFKPTDTFASPDGKVTGTYNQLQEAAQAKGMSVEQFIADKGLKQNTATSNPQQQASNQVDNKITATVSAAQSPEPTNFKLANAYLGTNEHQGRAALANFFQKSLGQNIDPGQVPWCAAFANAVEKASGNSGTGSLAARSFLNYGTATNTPTKGDIVVIDRGNDGVHGHVGFFAGYDDNGNVRILGGNQNNSVSIKSYPRAKVLGFRRPPSAQIMQQLVQNNQNSQAA